MPTIEELEEVARRCRVDTIKSLRCSQSGHPGSSLSAMDAMVAIYHGGFLRYDPAKALSPDQDHFLLSVGHAVPGLYSCLAHAGFAPVSSLKGLREYGTGLEGHAKRGTFPGVEASAGSLGQGLSIGIGLALGMKIRNEDHRVFVLMSDGEQQEGSTWEAAMAAPKWKLDNLVAIVDNNGNQINGPTSEIMPTLDSISEKYRAFHWNTLEIDGNDMADVVRGLQWAVDSDGPAVLVSNTATGHPISYMSGDYHWHHGVITEELFLQAMEDLHEPVSRTEDATWLPGSTGAPNPSGASK